MVDVDSFYKRLFCAAVDNALQRTPVLVARMFPDEVNRMVLRLGRAIPRQIPERRDEDTKGDFFFRRCIRDMMDEEVSFSNLHFVSFVLKLFQVGTTTYEFL